MKILIADDHAGFHWLYVEFVEAVQYLSFEEAYEVVKRDLKEYKSKTKNNNGINQIISSYDISYQE